VEQSILESVHKTAQDLHAAGAMQETTLREFDAICLSPPITVISNDTESKTNSLLFDIL